MQSFKVMNQTFKETVQSRFRVWWSWWLYSWALKLVFLISCHVSPVTMMDFHIILVSNNELSVCTVMCVSQKDADCSKCPVHHRVFLLLDLYDVTQRGMPNMVISVTEAPNLCVATDQSKVSLKKGVGGSVS